MVPSLGKLAGKVAVVTGASSGIGAATAEFLVNKGLIVAGLARRSHLIEEKAKQLSGKSGKLHAIQADMSREGDILKAFKWIGDNLGGVHVLINNAGISKSSFLTKGETEAWKNILDVNVVGLCIATRETVKSMRENKINGHIIHINSIGGHKVIHIPGTNLYTASKFAVTALAETLRFELMDDDSKIKVTSLSPGMVRTELTNLRPNLSPQRKRMVENLPFLTPEDVAEAVGYVLSTPEHVEVCLIISIIPYRTYQYWKRKNLPYLEPQIPFGNFGAFVGPRKHMGIRLKGLYDILKQKGWKHGGIYGILTPFYFPIDLDYVRNIMTRDFQYFSDRGIYHNEKADPLSAHLVNIAGPRWRNLRTKLTPTFTSGKMRKMFQTLLDCEGNLQKKIQLEYERKAPIDIKEVLGCFTTDIIGSCAFGLECNSFADEDSPFRVYGRKVFNGSATGGLKRTVANTLPKLFKALNISLIPEDIHNFFVKIVNDTVNYREKNDVVRNDFMQLLIDLKNNRLAEEDGYKRDGTTLTMEEIAAQSFVFFLAGFETSSTAMTFVLYELAKHQEIQDRVRNEIRTVLAKHDGQITYDAIHDMKYLNQVIDEALRMYPPLPLVSRRCVKEYRVPGTDVVIEKGIMILISILGIHYDEEYYPNPHEFNPDRFSEENKSQRHNYTHLPFGEGPRNCIGMRFGLMQTKVGLTSLLRNFKFTLNERTREPLDMKPNPMVLAAKGDIWLDVHKL